MELTEQLAKKRVLIIGTHLEMVRNFLWKYYKSPVPKENELVSTDQHEFVVYLPKNGELVKDELIKWILGATPDEVLVLSFAEIGRKIEPYVYAIRERYKKSYEIKMVFFERPSETAARLERERNAVNEKTEK